MICVMVGGVGGWVVCGGCGVGGVGGVIAQRERKGSIFTLTISHGRSRRSSFFRQNF